MLIATFRYSKTIQFGDRILQTLPLAIPEFGPCPVTFKAFNKICSVVTLKPRWPLFFL